MTNQNSKISRRKRTKILHFDFCILNSGVGFGLIETVVAAALISLVLTAFVQVANISLKLLQKEKHSLEASYLLEEGVEGVRVIRDAGWNANIAPLADGANYYLVATSTYMLTQTPSALINGRYLRTVVFGAVVRDGSDRIAQSGTPDAGTRQVKITVAWSERSATSSLDSVLYLTNFRQN